jgi:branched-chain amino acid transport system permease protein
MAAPRTLPTAADGVHAASPRADGTTVRRVALAAFAIFLVALPLLPVPEFWITQANYIGLYTLVVFGLVLLTGVAGLTSFGQAAFVGLGAYTAAYLTLTYGVSPWLTIWIGLAFTAVAALVLAWVTLRMSGHYLPLATIAWGLSLFYLLGNLDFLGKYDGLLGIPALSFFGTTLNTGRTFFYLLWAIVVLAAVAVTHLLDSRAGRALRAVKGGTTMAEAMGVDTFRVKVTAFVLAALLASVSGWLFAHFQRTVNPSPFGLNMGIEYLFMAVLGGVGYVWGALVGAGVVQILKDQLQVWLPRLMGTSGNYEIIVFGIVLVLMLQYARDGIWAFVDAALPRARRKVDWTDAPPLAERARPPHGETVLDVRAARKEFGGLVAVNDVSFTVKAGEILGLIGPNGAGKSTTFNLVTGVLPATRGEIALLGGRIDRLHSREIARLGVARTFQHVKMIATMTVLENVALGAHLRGRHGIPAAMLRLDRAEERRLMREAERQLRRIGMAELMHEQAGNLALGRQRLMEIARALAADPILLLLDEPAAGLRLKEKEGLADVLRQLRSEGLSILLVEHDTDLVMGLVDRVVVMEFGTKLIDGTPEEVQASPAVRAAYLGTEH